MRVNPLLIFVAFFGLSFAVESVTQRYETQRLVVWAHGGYHHNVDGTLNPLDFIPKVYADSLRNLGLSSAATSNVASMIHDTTQKLAVDIKPGTNVTLDTATVGGVLNITVNASGSIATGMQIVDDANYTIASSISVVLYKRMTADRTVTLPDPVANANREIWISNGGNGAFSVLFGTYTVRQNAVTWASGVTTAKSVLIKSDGTEWWFVKLQS